MRKAASICRGILWVLLAAVLFVQVMTIVSLYINNQQVILLEDSKREFPLAVLLIVASCLLLGGVLLFGLIKKRRYIGLILCAVAAVIFFITALEIHRAFPTSVGADGQMHGISFSRMIFRHMTPIGIPLLMLVSWLLERGASRREPLEAPSEKRGFDLLGEPLFKDE